MCLVTNKITVLFFPSSRFWMNPDTRNHRTLELQKDRRLCHLGNGGFSIFGHSRQIRWLSHDDVLLAIKLPLSWTAKKEYYQLICLSIDFIYTEYISLWKRSIPHIVKLLENKILTLFSFNIFNANAQFSIFFCLISFTNELYYIFLHVDTSVGKVCRF